MPSSRIKPAVPAGHVGVPSQPGTPSVRPTPRSRGLDLAAAAPVPPQIALIQERLEGSVWLSDESKIIETLRQTPAADLNAVIGAVDLHELLDEVEDHFWPLPQYRTQLLALLSKDRVGDLDVANRSRLIGALQVGRTNSVAEVAVRDLFLATKGPDLTELKNRVDAGGDYRDLQHLLHHDIDRPGIRASVLAHFDTEAKTQPKAGVKLLSDIDDTLYSSLHDARYDKGTVYPGVHAFHRAIAGQPADGQTNLTFLSARPQDRAGILESKWTQHSLEKKGVPAHVVLSGSLSGLRNHDAMAEKKLENFEQYKALFGEYQFVFVGDSGQGDATLAENMRGDHADAVPLVFIHDLGTPQVVDPAARAAAKAQGLVYFDTYVGAALAARQANLIDDAGLKGVIDASEARLGELSEATAALLVRDIRAARRLR